MLHGKSDKTRHPFLRVTSHNYSGVERFFTMNIVRLFGASLILTMLGGVAAVAQPVPALPSSQVTSDQALAWSLNLPQKKQVTSAPQVRQEPKKLPLADFGQWDEAASEN
jgi:hypothetical protein